jgi:hypothetical protein
VIQLLKELLQTGQGSRTYLASAALAALGTLLLAAGGDQTFALFLLAQSGGLAALRSAIGRIQTYLKSLEGRLDSAANP